MAFKYRCSCSHTIAVYLELTVQLLSPAKQVISRNLPSPSSVIAVAHAPTQRGYNRYGYLSRARVLFVGERSACRNCRVALPVGHAGFSPNTAKCRRCTPATCFLLRVYQAALCSNQPVEARYCCCNTDCPTRHHDQSYYALITPYVLTFRRAILL